MTKNSIGIAIPTYKRQTQLTNLLASIPKELKIYVSDNGATLTNTFIKQHPWVTFNVLIGNPVTMYTNWNIVVRMTKEEWVVIPSDDDIYYDDSFKIIKSQTDKYSGTDIIVFGHNIVDKDYNIIDRWVPSSLMLYDPPYGFGEFKYGVQARLPSIVIRRSLLIDLGLFDENFQITAADSYLVQQALLKGKSVFVPEVVSGYRVWPNSATSATIGTIEWMEDIDKWCKSLHMHLLSTNEYSHEALKIYSEIYARNLCAGIKNVRKNKGITGGWAHLLRCKYPYQALPKTQLRLWFNLIKP